MKNRMLMTAMALSLATATLHAAPVNGADPVPAKPAKVKMITVHMKNASNAAVMVKDGDLQSTIQPGKEASLKVPAGSQVTLVGATANRAAGSVLGTADSNLSGSTLVID